MNAARDSVALIGRILLALVFVMSGFDKLTGFTGTVGYIASENVPMPKIAAVVAIVIELGGGLAIVAGWMTRWAALVIAIFLIVITPIFHDFWTMTGAERMTNQIMFMKNVSMLGGFLVLFAFGPGKYSVDRG